MSFLKVTTKTPTYTSVVAAGTQSGRFIDWWGNGKVLKRWPQMHEGYDYGLRRLEAPLQYVLERQFQPREYRELSKEAKEGKGIAKEEGGKRLK
jgi:hypothetical protein